MQGALLNPAASALAAAGDAQHFLGGAGEPGGAHGGRRSSLVRGAAGSRGGRPGVLPYSHVGAALHWQRWRRG